MELYLCGIEDSNALIIRAYIPLLVRPILIRLYHIIHEISLKCYASLYSINHFDHYEQNKNHNVYVESFYNLSIDSKWYIVRRESLQDLFQFNKNKDREIAQSHQTKY